MHTHQPKGGMCCACQHRDRKCNHLNFASMPVIKTERDGTRIVKCADFVKAERDAQ